MLEYFHVNSGLFQIWNDCTVGTNPWTLKITGYMSHSRFLLFTIFTFLSSHLYSSQSFLAFLFSSTLPCPVHEPTAHTKSSENKVGETTKSCKSTTPSRLYPSNANLAKAQPALFTKCLFINFHPTPLLCEKVITAAILLACISIFVSAISQAQKLSSFSFFTPVFSLLSEESEHPSRVVSLGAKKLKALPKCQIYNSPLLGHVASGCVSASSVLSKRCCYKNIKHMWTFWTCIYLIFFITEKAAQSDPSSLSSVVSSAFFKLIWASSAQDIHSLIVWSHAANSHLKDTQLVILQWKLEEDKTISHSPGEAWFIRGKGVGGGMNTKWVHFYCQESVFWTNLAFFDKLFPFL